MAGLFGSWLAFGVARAQEKPNLLVFLADDLGARDLGCTGSTFYRTPAIDRLAAEGMLFTRGYAASPVCSPTRAALMTGRHPARVKITNFIAGNRRGRLLPAEFLHALPPEEVTVAELLKGAEYSTGVFGKWHLGDGGDVSLHGFDVAGSTMVRPGGGPADDPMHAKTIAAQAAAFIEANRERRWFCYVPMHSVHVPLKARPDLVAEEERRSEKLPPADRREVVEGDRKARAVQDLPVYAAMVRELDETVATVLAAVEKSGGRDKTLVIFTSDNGGLATAEGSPTSNLPLRAGKGYVYEGGIRVPLIVRWPGVVEPGTTTGVPATTLDVAAALLDAAGVQPPAGIVLDGVSLRPVCAGTGPLAARDLFWHYPHYSNQGGRPAAALLAGDGPRPGTEKLVEHFEDGRVELFDLANDPGERRDLSEDRRERASQLRARLAAWRKSVQAAVPTPNPRPVEPFGPDAVPTPVSTAAKRPNIIYVMTDDQGYGDIAAHGNPIIHTPNLDRLHAESVRLTEFHASPTCSPTRAALMTGRHEFRSGVTHTVDERERLALSATTLPQLLRRAGRYTTGIFGKWHLGDEDAYQPGRRGFDRVFIHGGGGIGQSYPGSCGDAPGNTYFNPVIRSNGTFVKTKGYCTDVFFDAAIAWIDEQRKTDKPFFCLVTPNAPHGPLDCPPHSDAAYLPKLTAAGIADPKRRSGVAKFYGMVENIDMNIGRLIEKLDEWGIAGDTLIVFTTDNGTATGAPVFNDGMRGQKGTPYRGGTRVPSFWRWKGTLPAGVDVPALTAQIDVLPTLCELADVPPPPAVAAQIEGRSLVPLLRDKNAAWPDRPLFTHLGRWARGKASQSAYAQCRVREGKWSLVNTNNSPERWELYDLSIDPAEKHDVAAEHPDLVARLSATYDGWWQSVQPHLVNEDLDGPAENPFKTAYWSQFGPPPKRPLRPGALPPQ